VLPGDTAPPKRPRAPADCEALEDADLAGYCRLQLASRRPLLTIDAATLCGEAGSWVAECRAEWVSNRLSAPAFTRAQLLEGCGGDPDCNFRVLDDRPEGDVLAQIQDCEDLASRFFTDCSRHALNRWRKTRPGPAELLRVVEGAPSATIAGMYTGIAVACNELGRCVGPPKAIATCEAAIRDVAARPEICDGRR